MKTAELIALLARDVRPIRKGMVARKIMLALGIGALLTLVALLLAFPLRPLAEAVQTFAFWMKLVFTGTLAAGGVFVVFRFARAADAGRLGLLVVDAAGAAILCLATAEMILTAPDDRYVLWLGQTANVCSLRIVVLSIPIFVALMAVMRSLAPTQLASTGAAIGLTSGALAATIYGLHCPETSAAFVATWYSLGILTTTIVGGVIGQRSLRW